MIPFYLKPKHLSNEIGIPFEGFHFSNEIHFKGTKKALCPERFEMTIQTISSFFPDNVKGVFDKFFRAWNC